jgi:DNA repair exonuclease SbcCD ATPase subunit
MTDAEIIKALEYCKNQGFVSKCCECRYKNSSGCVELLITDALDLINRQKAEIERLNTALDMAMKFHSEAADERDSANAEIERLETEYESVYEQARADILGNMADGGTSCHWCIEQHKAEAIKEFAERLKAECRQDRYAIQTSTKFGVVDKQYLRVVDESDIDNLVKEMVGDTE